MGTGNRLWVPALGARMTRRRYLERVRKVESIPEELCSFEQSATTH
jgi:hypothetical protein